MSARCPKCDWVMPIFQKRPMENAFFECPSCSSLLKFKSLNMLVKTLIVLVLVLSLILIRVDEERSIAYVAVMLGLILILMLVANKCEKLVLESSF